MTIMKLTLNLADFGIQYEVAEVAIAELEVDKGYQRGETSLINFIAGAFNPLAFGIIWVGRREETGKMYIVDGLQRTRGAEKAGHTRVPALIFTSEGRKQEAAIFRQLNAFRRRVSRMDIFRSALKAEIPYAVEINRAVNGAGLKVAVRDASQTHEPKWPHIKAVAALEWMYEEGGSNAVTAALETVGFCWQDQVDALRTEALKGVHQFRHVYGDTVDLDHMVAKLSTKPMSQILIDAADHKARQQRTSGIVLPKFVCVYERLRTMYGKKPPRPSTNRQTETNDTATA